MTVMLVPAKGLQEAKSRLAEVLTLEARRTLSATMLRQVLRAARTCQRLERIVVISACQEVAQLAQQEGAHWMAEPADCAGKLQAVIDHGVATLRHESTATILVMMGDLPCLQTEDVNALVDALHCHDVVLAPDRYMLGTNALGLAMHVSLPTCFGRADSYRIHLNRFQDQGYSVSTLCSPGLALDIDTKADLADYLAARNSEEAVNRR